MYTLSCASNDFDSGLLLEPMENQRLKIVGEKIQTARQRLGLTQAELGMRIWTNLTDTAAQTRIYRIEKGAYEIDYAIAHKIFETLAIFDIDANTLEPTDENAALCFNKHLLLRYPELRHYIPLINAAAIKNRHEEVRRLVSAMAAAFNEGEPAQADHQTKGDPDPFQKGGKRS